MSEHIILAVITTGGALFGVFMLCLFMSANGKATVDQWIEARKVVRLAELEVKKIEAEHALKCPRLTDTPRRP
jgi:hypothetical protein